MERVRYIQRSLKALDDGASIFVGLGGTTEITSESLVDCQYWIACFVLFLRNTHLSFSKSVESSLLDAGSVLVKTHVLQHHNRTQQESSGVSKTLAGDIRSGTVDSLEDGALISNVSGGGETKTTNETSAHIGENVTVKVGHDQDFVVVWSRGGDHLQAGVVKQLGIKFDVGELLGHVARALEEQAVRHLEDVGLVHHRDLLAAGAAGSVQEETVGHLHDGSLVHDADLLLSGGLSMLESEAQDTLRGFPSDEFNTLDNTINNDVLNSGVFTLGVLTDQHSVDVVIWGLVSSNRAAWSQVGEEVESTTESQVQ